MATGEMVMSATDVTLPGVLPLILERHYVSGHPCGGTAHPQPADSNSPRPGRHPPLRRHLDVSKNGVHIVVHEYDVDKPAHAHVTGQPELTRRKQQAVKRDKSEIRRAVKRLGRRNHAEQEEEKRRKAAKDQKCGKG
ncbi:DUF6531 domain-containing protein [Streptomyces sp. NPDC048636]|uniref:DUF6531 domain-containing protein n=1 Tax=Streptomyces sp. NPDC048636 TaxID=3155762 RepID=UPI003432DF76